MSKKACELFNELDFHISNDFREHEYIDDDHIVYYKKLNQKWAKHKLVVFDLLEKTYFVTLVVRDCERGFIYIRRELPSPISKELNTAIQLKRKELGWDNE